MLGPAIPLALPEGDVEFACPRRGWKNEDKDELELLYGFDDGPSEKGRRLSVSDEGSEAFVEPRMKEVELMLSTPGFSGVGSDRVMVRVQSRSQGYYRRNRAKDLTRTDISVCSTRRDIGLAFDPAHS